MVGATVQPLRGVPHYEGGGLAMQDERLWRGERPKRAKGGTLYHAATGRTVSSDTYVLSVDNFERAEQAIALCLAHGLLAAAR